MQRNYIQISIDNFLLMLLLLKTTRGQLFKVRGERDCMFAIHDRKLNYTLRATEML